jgi:hypothetical protein
MAAKKAFLHTSIVYIDIYPKKLTVAVKFFFKGKDRPMAVQVDR